MINPLVAIGLSIGRRGIFLLFFSFLWISTGYRWTEEPPISDNYLVLYKALSADAWGHVFIVTGLLMGVGAFWKKFDDVSFAVSAWLAAFLGAMILLGYLPGVPGPAETGFTVALTYFFYTIFVLVISGWPEAPRGQQEMDD